VRRSLGFLRVSCFLPYLLPYFGLMEPLAASRMKTQGRSLGRSTPRVFTKTAWWRFAAERRQRYLARNPGVPTDAQAALVQSLIHLEWSALKAEDAGTMLGDREGREHRRLFQKFSVDLDKSIAAQPEDKPTPPTLADYLRAKDSAA
jgi:hypothetical protein